MPHSHHHPTRGETHGHRHATHAIAGRPTFSLLRLSAWERLGGSAALLSGLWLLVIIVLL
jgi:hypothetical protein